jgi:hypothetical protein
MRRLTLTIAVIVAVLVVAAAPALAERGGRWGGAGPSQGQPSEAPGHGRPEDPGAPGVGRGRPTRLPTPTAGALQPSLTRTPPAPREVRAASFSARGSFARWANPTTLILDDAWTNRAARVAISEAGQLSVIIGPATQYHVFGGGAGYSQGLGSVTIPAGARVHVRGTCEYPITSSGQVSGVPFLFAEKVIVELDVPEGED